MEGLLFLVVAFVFIRLLRCCCTHLPSLPLLTSVSPSHNKISHQRRAPLSLTHIYTRTHVGRGTRPSLPAIVAAAALCSIFLLLRHCSERASHHPIMAKIDVKVVILGCENTGSTHHLAFTDTIGAESILGPRERHSPTRTTQKPAFLIDTFLAPSSSTRKYRNNNSRTNSRSCIIDR